MAFWAFKTCVFVVFGPSKGALEGLFGTLVAPGAAPGLWERTFGHFWLSFVTFGVPFWHLWGPLWPTLGAFGLLLGPLWETLGSFGGHFGHFVETFWTSESTFCLHRLNLGKPRNPLEIRSSGAFWGSLDREILAYFGSKIDPRGTRRGKRGRRESKKTEKGAKKRPKRQSWWQKAAL